jgi:hypothetical protein
MTCGNGAWRPGEVGARVTVLVAAGSWRTVAGRGWSDGAVRDGELTHLCRGCSGVDESMERLQSRGLHVMKDSPKSRLRVPYQWIGGTRNDWRGQGHFRALTEEQEAWALANGFDEIIVKTKNRFYEMRSTLAQLNFDVIRFVPHPFDHAESKVFLSKRLGQHVIDAHRSRRSVVRGE